MRSQKKKRKRNIFIYNYVYGRPPSLCHISLSLNLSKYFLQESCHSLSADELMILGEILAVEERTSCETQFSQEWKGGFQPCGRSSEKVDWVNKWLCGQMSEGPVAEWDLKWGSKNLSQGLERNFCHSLRPTGMWHVIFGLHSVFFLPSSELDNHYNTVCASCNSLRKESEPHI